jgi:hypothetical protein
VGNKIVENLTIAECYQQRRVRSSILNPFFNGCNRRSCAFERSVTLSIRDAHPGSGGVLRQSGSFNVGNGGGVHGISFSEIALSAGQDYFIGLQNIRGPGIYLVEPILGNFANGQPPGTTLLMAVGLGFFTFVRRSSLRGTVVASQVQ